MVVQKSEVAPHKRIVEENGQEYYEWSKVVKKITENNVSIKYKCREIRQSLKLLQMEGVKE